MKGLRGVSSVFLIFNAYRELIRFDLYLRKKDFSGLYAAVRNEPDRQGGGRFSAEEICAAIDIACIWYWKRVLCLQRSAAGACLLKRHGLKAQMVLGAQQVPFRAHAWIEISGRVVNDKPYIPTIYSVLDRC
jgi:hypothetical protein